MELGLVASGFPVPSKASLRLHGICAFFALASLVWGYNIGIMGTIYVHPGFKNALNNPGATRKGLITGIYYLGTWTSYIFISHPVTDYLGRRWASFTGVFITGIGAAFQAGARHGSGALAMMIIGRIICGLGLAIVSTAVPLYQSEISPAKQRGRYVVMNHVGLVAGLSAAFWAGYGFSGWTTPNGDFYGWRISILVQYIPAVLFFTGIPFCPETPRWLMQNGQIEQAQKALAYLRCADPSSDIVTVELDEIRASVEAHIAAPESRWTSLFTHRPLFNRLWRAALLQFMSQMCGNTSMKYYLPTILASLGIEHRLTLMIGGIESTMKIGCTIIDMALIDRAGRRSTLIAGCLVMSIALLINGALPLSYPNNENRAADYACIVFIFFYTFGYSIGFGPAAWVYGAEIFPTNLRARGLNIAASGGSIGSIIAAQVWPIAIDTIGSKTYFIFMVINIVSGVIIYFFYPETKRKTLEEMDAVFGDHRIASILNLPEDTAYDTPAESAAIVPKNSRVAT